MAFLIHELDPADYHCLSGTFSQEERVGNGVARWQREWMRPGVVHLSAKQVWRRSTC